LGGVGLEEKERSIIEPPHKIFERKSLIAPSGGKKRGERRGHNFKKEVFKKEICKCALPGGGDAVVHGGQK